MKLIDIVQGVYNLDIGYLYKLLSSYFYPILGSFIKALALDSSKL